MKPFARSAALAALALLMGQAFFTSCSTSSPSSPAPVTVVLAPVTVFSTATFTPSPNLSPVCVPAYAFHAGYDRVGGSRATFDNDVAVRASATGPGPVTATSVSANFNSSNYHLQVALYADNGTGSFPTTLLCQSGEVYVTGTGWITLAIPPTAFASPATFWIVLQGDSTAQLAYDAGPSGLCGTNFAAYNAAGFPASYGSFTPNSDLISVYASLCGSTIHPTATATPTSTYSPTPSATPKPRITDTPACVPLYQARAGYDTIGSTHAVLTNDFAVMVPVINDKGAVTATGISAYHYSNASWVQAGLYADNGFGTAPSTLLSQSGPSYVTANGWVHFDIDDVPLTAPTTLWLAFQSDASFMWAYDAGAANVYAPNYVYTYTAGFPVSFGGYGTFNYQVSAYLDYCSNSPQSTETFTPTPTATGTPTYTPTPRVTDTPVCASPSQWGYTTVGATHAVFTNDFAVRASVGGSGPVTALAISAYHYSNSGWVQAALYDDNGFGTAPTTLLSQSGAYYVTTNGWIDFDIHDVSLSAPATCWLAFQTDASCMWAYDAGPANIFAPNDVYVYTAGFPASFGGSGSFNYQLSAYLKTCP